MGFPPQGTVVVTPITSEEVWDYTTRVLTNLSDARAQSGEFEVGFPVTPVSQTVAVATDLTPQLPLTPSIPSGASLVSAKLIAMITALATLPTVAEEIDLQVEVSKDGAAYEAVFTGTDVIGLVNNQSATVAWAGAMEVAEEVNAMDVPYRFRFRVAGFTDPIRFTQGFVLIVKYRMA